MNPGLARPTALVATAVALALVAGACSSEPAAAPRPDRTHVEGGAIVQRDGRTLVLRGANVAGSQKNPPYLGAYTKDELVALRREWGFDAARFIITWAAIEPQKGVYDDAYLAALDERISWCEQAGLYVILDMHQDIYGEGFVLGGGDGAPKWTCDASHYGAFVPQNPWYFNALEPNVVACVDGFWGSDELRAHYTEAWRRVAAKLKGHTGILGFDPMNEPAWGSYSMLGYEADLLTPLYLAVTKAVRAEAPGWLAFLEPGASRNLGVSTKLVKFPFADVVYSPHSYDRDAEGGTAFDDAKRKGILDNFGALRGEADALGGALWIGEYGGQSNLPGVTAYMDAEYDGAAQVGASSMYWSYDKNDGGYSLYDASGTKKQVLFDVVARPYPMLVAGKLQRWEYDESSRAVSVFFTPDASIARTAPTEIVLPPHLYPNGVTVDCGGCKTETGDGVVRVFASASPIVVHAR